MVISYAEFLNLPAEKQAAVLDEMRKEHGVGGVVKMWGISTSRLYNLIHELNLPVSKRGRKAKSSKKPGSFAAKNGKEAIITNKAEEVTTTSRLSFTLTAEGDGALLLGRLQPLFTAMSAANIKFKVSLIAEEV